jgi:hypothetical protein
VSVHAALRASSNLREIKVGSRIVYLEALPPPYTTLNSDIVVVVGTGDESARPQIARLPPLGGEPIVGPSR